MIDRRKRRFDGFDRCDDRRRRARHHHHLDAEQARRLDLRIGGGAAAVLGNDDIDMMPPQQSAFAFQREGAAIEDVVDIRKPKRPFGGVDAADEIVMLRRRFRMVSALPARRQEDMAGRLAECRDGRRDALHVPPAIARQALPFGAAQSDRSERGGRGRDGGVFGNSFGERVRGVDQQPVAPGFQKVGQRHGTAETTNTDRNRLLGRFLGTSCQRQQNIAIITRRERFGEQARFARAAENQDAKSSHV